MKLKSLLFVALIAAAVLSCKNEQKTDPTPDPGDQKTVYDYSLDSNWLVKPNPDSILYNVDVFYVYPTVVWTGKTNAAELNPTQKVSAYMAYLEQAHCMSGFANMYAPFYRQCSMDYMPITNENIVNAVRTGIGKDDIFAALDYYFEHYNNDRPFILASHSQGTAMLRTVFEEYVHKDAAHENYFKRMIAAYMLGFSVPKAWLEQVGFNGAQGADDIGVIIAYNTEGPNASGTNALVTSDDYVINPLTWTTDTAKAEASQNLGSFEWTDKATLKYRITEPGTCDAQVNPNRASLTCTTDTNYVSMEGDPFGTQSLHLCDWDGYYVNLRENARARIDAYFSR